MCINIFRKYFNVPETYSNAEINRYILKKSIKEVNNKTRISVISNIIKRKKYTSHIKFEFSGGYNHKVV
jgi:plasmid replication initiation protein